MPDWIHNYLPLIATLGVGSVAAALIARGVAIAQLRQAWINGLRDDISEFIAAVAEERSLQQLVRERTRRDEHPTSDDDGRLLQFEFKMETALARIAMRINPKEETHRDLLEKCRQFPGCSIDESIRPAATALIEDAQIILKREWQVTKWGSLAPVVEFFKRDV